LFLPEIVQKQSAELGVPQSTMQDHMKKGMEFEAISPKIQK
jgi:hypothetical protein